MTREAVTQRGASDAAQGTYERTDMDPRAAWLTLGAIMATVALVCLGVAALFALFGSLRQAPPGRPVAPWPQLQTNERRDRMAIERAAQTRLHSNVTIEQAMRQTAAAGWDGPR